MKKLYILLITAFCLFASCKSTMFITYPIKVEELESPVFIINKVVFKSNTIEPTDEELIKIFELFPYSEIQDIVYEKKGIVLETSLIQATPVQGNIEYNIVYDVDTNEDLEELPEWEINYEVPEDNDQLCTLIFSMDPPDGFLSVQVVMNTTRLVPAKKEGKEDKIQDLQTTVYHTFDNWTFKNIFVDQRSCAQIKFNKHLTPTFVQNELYNVYKVLNQTEDGYLNVPVKDFIEIRFNISDPGNMFFSPAEIYNAKLEYLFDPGKKYMIKYKLKRFSPDSTKWKVIFVIKEEKPKQTK